MKNTLILVVIILFSCNPKIIVNNTTFNKREIKKSKNRLDSSQWEEVKTRKWHPFAMLNSTGKFILNNNDSDYLMIINDSLIIYSKSKDSTMFFSKYDNDSLTNIIEFYKTYGVRLSSYFVYSPQKFIIKKNYNFYSISVNNLIGNCIIVQCKINKANIKKKQKRYLILIEQYNSN